jgi:hypothetical protein
MAKFNFYLKEKTAQSETPLILYIRFDGNTLKYYSGKTILPKYWNESDQLARQVKEFGLAKILNDNLKFLKGTAEKSFEDLVNELKRTPSTKELKKRLDEILKPSEEVEALENRPPTFLELFKRFIQDSETGLRLTDKGKRFEKRTIQKYNTTYLSLEDFGKIYHLTFDSIDKNFYTKFVAYLNKKKYTLNTLGKYIQVLKTFLTYSTENGYNTNQYFKTKKFKVHQVAGFSIYLTEAEIQAIYKKDF